MRAEYIKHNRHCATRFLHGDCLEYVNEIREWVLKKKSHFRMCIQFAKQI